MVTPQRDGLSEVQLETFQTERCFGIAVDTNLDACRAHVLLLASCDAVYKFPLDSLDPVHWDIIAKVLNDTSCVKAGVGLAQKMEPLLVTFPNICFEAWVDLAEYLWVNSVTTERLSLDAMCRWLLRRPPDLGVGLEAPDCRKLWPRVKGLVCLRQIQDGLGRVD